jgi:lipopolysaccharide transport system ATP-binding protein
MSSDEVLPAAEVVLRVQGVGKHYQMRQSLLDRLLRRPVPAQHHWALRGVSFELRRGEAFAIVGRNGSGKSTLLQLITGNLQLTEGRIEVEGRIGALLELGSGFNPEFTGRENVQLQGVLMGLSDRRIAELLPTIEEFADLGEFFDAPVRTYSSGMFVRLAFAVQVQSEPDILIVDEALAVGDALFQKRCFRKLEDLQRRGVTLLFVSHDQETVRSLTQRALLLDQGKPLLLGNSGEVVLAYRRLLHDAERAWHQHVLDQMKDSHAGGAPVLAPAAAVESRPAGHATSERLEFGDGAAQIVAVTLHGRDGAEGNVFRTGDDVVVRVTMLATQDVEHLSVAVRIRNRQGVKVYSWGTLNQDMAIRAGLASGEQFWPRRFRAGERVVVTFRWLCRLGADFYEVQAAVSREDTPDYKNQLLLHWRDEAAFFQVTIEQDSYFFGGAFDLQMRADW